MNYLVVQNDNKETKEIRWKHLKHARRRLSTIFNRRNKRSLSEEDREKNIAKEKECHYVLRQISGLQKRDDDYKRAWKEARFRHPVKYKYFWMYKLKHKKPAIYYPTD